MTPTEREQQAREFFADYSLGNNIERLATLLAATRRAALEEELRVFYCLCAKGLQTHRDTHEEWCPKLKADQILAKAKEGT